MFFELRQYNIKSGQRENWIQLMEEEILPFQLSKGMVVVGSFVSENPEEDGYWISPDRKIIEMFYNWDLDDAEHHDWIRTARKRASARKQRDSKGVNDDQAT